MLRECQETRSNIQIEKFLSKKRKGLEVMKRIEQERRKKQRTERTERRVKTLKTKIKIKEKGVEPKKHTKL